VLKQREMEKKALLGEILIGMGCITKDDLANALAAQKLMRRGKHAEVMLKIESKRGIQFVEKEWRDLSKKYPQATLVAARGDMYVEINKPHQIARPLRRIAQEDPRALVGSRILLSTIQSPIPSCSDFLDLEWLADIGYQKMMLCDELCLKEELLARAVSAFDNWRNERST